LLVNHYLVKMEVCERHF